MVFHTHKIDVFSLILKKACEDYRNQSVFSNDMLDLSIEAGCLLWIDILRSKRQEQIEDMQRERGMLYWVEKEQYRALMREQMRNKEKQKEEEMKLADLRTA